MTHNQPPLHFSRLPHKPGKNSGESGIAYVAILFILVILSSLGLAFIMKVGTETVVTMNRGNAMQAQYLAESAANHALWRMLNEPGFPAAGNVYYMHSLVGGRYGYKVRKPTPTTFATVATVGAMGDNVVNQGYVPYVIPSNVMAVYGNNQDDIPDSRRLVGASLSDAANTLDMGLMPFRWVRAVGCPLRKEVIMGSLDTANDLTLAVWNGTSWGNQLVFNTVSDLNFRTFDIAYESLSGAAVVVGWTGTNRDIAYTVWNGFTWNPNPPQRFFTVSGTYQTKLIIAASKPGKDNILVGSVDNSNAFRLYHWNGNSFLDLGVIEANMQAADFGIAEIVFEQQSGDAIILWSKLNDPALYYRTWSSSGGLSAPAQLPAFNAVSTVIRVAADRTSDHIFVAAVDNFKQISVAVWNGTAWIDSRKSIANTFDNVGQVLDVAWESSGDEAVVAWTTWYNPFTNVDYFTWRKGTTLASHPVQQGPAMGNTPDRVRLMPIYGTEKMLLLSHDQNHNLFYNLWTGNKFAANSGILLNNDIADMKGMRFDIAEALVPTVGGGGGGGNSAPVVSAGPDSTILWPTDTINLDGTVTDDGLPNPPATFTTLWTKVSGPGTVTFGDAALIDTTARFSVPGVYVLRLTADDGALTNFAEVTITVKASKTLLMVVNDAVSPDLGEIDRKALVEGWGWYVSLIEEKATQAEFNSAAAGADVAYVPETIDSLQLGVKLREATIGVVIEEQTNNFGICTNWLTKSLNQIIIINNSHYITTQFSTGLLTIVSSLQPVTLLNSGTAPSINTLGNAFNSGSIWKPSLTVIETGGALADSGIAAGRRVQLPWGGLNFNINALNADGKTILRRSLEWGAHFDSTSVLLVVNNPSILTSQESQRKALIESWNMNVTLIDDDDSQANFNAALSLADVAYVPEDVLNATVGTKLRNTTAGVVNEKAPLSPNLGFTATSNSTSNRNNINVLNNTHYLTTPFSLGLVTILSSNKSCIVLSGQSSLDLSTLANAMPDTAEGMLCVLNTGNALYGGGTAAGRRVQLPWGPSGFDIGWLNAAGQGLMKRAIEWGAGLGVGGSQPSIYVNGITMGSRKSSTTYYGQATVWIKDTGGVNMVGATVSGNWTGSVTGSDSGVTGAGGTIMLESPGKKNGGTFTFTVTNVTLSGYTYNPALNVMTSNTITAP